METDIIGDGAAPLNVAAAAPQSDLSALTALLDTGGPVLWLLAALSVVALTLILAKTVQFAVARLGGPALRHVAGAALEHSRGAQPTAAEDAGRRAARRIMRPLESGLTTLGMIAMLSPLIGLLGTVLGMIEAFRALETAATSVDPSLLSGGIWVALLTTAAGLVVAIPTTLAHGWFDGRLARFADEAESAIGEAVSHRGPSPEGLRIAAE